MASTAIIVHGGAGVGMTPERQARVREGCERAARAGGTVLEAGGTALDAVCAAVGVLEDDPEFNAGYGSVPNRAGDIEVDACVMTGALDTGAVAAVPWLRHPVRVARLVLEDGEHILLCGPGALAFAREHGIEPESRDTLLAPAARESWEAMRARREAPPVAGRDTVGACALDVHGRLASATSTGGTYWKRPGRIGDSPIVGAGTYAEDGAGAASATGLGEAILRVGTARRAVELLASGTSVEEAARIVIAELGTRGRGDGGVILLDSTGHSAFACNTPSMSWARLACGRLESGIHTP